MRVFICSVWLCLSSLPVWADAKITLLMDALQVPDVISILRDEGIMHGAELDSSMLDGQGGAFWSEQILRIYDAQRMHEVLRRAFEQSLDSDDVEQSLAFFSTPAAQQIITLENEARRIMSDPQIEERARAKYEIMRTGDDPLMAAVAEFIRVNDLLERNVASALTSNFQFYMGLSDGGYYKRSESDILQEVWSDQEDVRDDTEGWLNGFFLLAYQPLPPDDLQSYIAFSQTEAGRNLNAALFDGFGTMYKDISYALGRAIALNVQGDEI